MMKAKTILQILSIIVMVNCSFDKTVHKNEFCHFQLPNSGEDLLKTSYFADTILFIPLETTPESFLDFIVQIWMNDSLILVNSWNSGLLLFDIKGNYIRKIGKIGHGPEEYLTINHFDVIHDTIYVSSTGRRSLLRYSFNGTFCDDITLNYEPVFFGNTVDNKLACYIREKGKILIYNNLNMPDTVIVEYGVTHGRYNYGTFDYWNMPYLLKSSSGLVFNNYLSDTLWHISDDEKNPAYILNLKKMLLPYDKQIEFCNGDIQSWEKIAKQYYYIHLIPFKSKVFIFQSHWSTIGYNAIYIANCETGSVEKFNTSYFYDDLVSKQNLLLKNPKFVYPVFSDDYLVAVINPINLLESYSDDNNKAIPSDSWLEQIKEIKEGDNPIIILLKIK